jgi:hypothetical protein
MSIDTLKLARRLEAANMSKDQAEAIAEGEATLTKQDLAVAVADMRTEFRTGLAKLKNEVLYWVVGSVTLGVIVNHFWK